MIHVCAYDFIYERRLQLWLSVINHERGVRRFSIKSSTSNLEETDQWCQRDRSSGCHQYTVCVNLKLSTEIIWAPFADKSIKQTMRRFTSDYVFSGRHEDLCCGCFHCQPLSHIKQTILIYCEYIISDHLHFIHFTMFGKIILLEPVTEDLTVKIKYSFITLLVL